jgi:hypothetical protein
MEQLGRARRGRRVDTLFRMWSDYGGIVVAIYLMKANW